MNPFFQLAYLRADLKRWNISSLKEVFYAVFESGIWVTIFYRLSRFLFLIDIPIIKIPLRLCAFLLFKLNEILGCAIRPGCDIGPGLYIGHTGIIRIHPEVKAGKNLSIGQQVTIGTKGLGVKGAPVLGDNVYIGVGAKVLGPIKIGNNVRIGANAVVITDVPDDCTAVGVPAKIIKRKNTE